MATSRRRPDPVMTCGPDIVGHGQLRLALRGLSSMATKGLLSELAASYGAGVEMEAAGGVDAARRVRDGEALDIVVLAHDVMQKLETEGHLVRGSLRTIARSSMAAAVRTETTLAELADAEDVRRAILAASRVGYSTGPSGTHLLHLVERLGLRGVIGERLVQAPPGVPVGRLLANGTVDLAFQQRSELMGIDGIVVIALPSPVGMDTVFTAGISVLCNQMEKANAFTMFLSASTTSDAKRRHGMEPP